MTVTHPAEAPLAGYWDSRLRFKRGRCLAEMGDAVTVWVVRGGEDLKFLPWFESEDVVGIGWSELPRSPVGMSRQELAGMLRATYPDASPNTIANNTGQIWNFVNTIALGDLVVVPLKASRSFRVGRVVGPAEHRDHLPDLAAVRPVEWEAGAGTSQALAR